MNQPSRAAQRDTTRPLPASTESRTASPTNGAAGDSRPIERALDDWRKDTRGPQVSVEGERKPEFSTQALHWPVAPLYTPLDLEASGFDYLRDVGFPGQYPYTRG